jgi:hypothetical protein
MDLHPSAPGGGEAVSRTALSNVEPRRLDGLRSRRRRDHGPVLEGGRVRRLMGRV